jgi:hypothetical protein
MVREHKLAHTNGAVRAHWSVNYSTYIGLKKLGLVYLFLTLLQALIVDFSVKYAIILPSFSIQRKNK